MATVKQYDAVILGAGAAGMMCAAQAGQQGLRVALVDHAVKIGEKIRISGGGRCNFTNRLIDGQDPAPFYVSQQPRFVRHALARYTAADFTSLLDRHGIAYQEKHKGQLFCRNSAQDIIAMLQTECRSGNVDWHTGRQIRQTAVSGPSEPAFRPVFETVTDQEILHSRFLVVATGGLAAPAVGATPLGYETAKQFGHAVVPPQAALVPLRFENWEQAGYADLAGIALPVRIGTAHGRGMMWFDEDLLFRHKGLSGPAVLQISSYWQSGQTLEINLAPDMDLAERLCRGKTGSRSRLKTALKQLCPHLPDRLLSLWLARSSAAAYAEKNWADTPDTVLAQLGSSFNCWTVLPSGSDGHKKAEVTRGGVDVSQIDTRTMQSKLTAGLYFIGEVMDVTGWLGGYNFQWAWSSAVCAARHMAETAQAA
ncbi:aminoacetone oxidase family FAD-binding enzyme [Neisseria leonii]|uniref:Aminoacetone oxidase family FAD-binding enzyme n=1 Tax=Neisseria leonii TaxID=2995413 RepID=A0A9X4IEE8_9NEIS|nr:aminoacetone oxidase family FAD-binding enzyme [Neisseria sp. 51.81]MDD9328137.1 NAD(P)/FAD-dependent oxidoreductase [Neisseria sp. 51.81]